MSRALGFSLVAIFPACSGPAVAVTDPDGSSSSGTSGESQDPALSSSAATGDIPPFASSGELGTETDAASSTGGGTESSSDSTCGDGRLEGDEECDDGNQEDGDACRADCRLAFEVVEMRQFHIDNDLVFEVAVDASGTAWVAGASASQASVDSILLSVAPRGGMDVVWQAGTPEDDDFSSVAVLPSGDLIASGGFTAADDRDGRLMRLTPAGDVVWTQDYDGPDGGDGPADRDYAHDVTVNAAGEILVAYSSREVGEGADIRISKYDGSGTELWSWRYGGTAQDDDAPAKLALAPNGDVVFGGYTQDAGELRGGVLGRLSDSGELLALATSLPDRVFALGVDDEGVVAVGEGWVERRSPSLEDVVYTELSPGFDVGFGVTPIDGGVVIVGGVGVAGEQSNAFVGAWGTDGAMWWSDTYDNPSTSLADMARDAALTPDGGLVVVGTTTELGAATDIFVRRYELFD